MEVSIEKLKEEIKKLDKTIYECRFQRDSYDDDIDNENCYRRDSERIDALNKKIDILEQEIDKCKEKRAQVEGLLNLMLKRMELMEKRAKLEDQYDDPNSNLGSDEKALMLFEICALNQDISYYDNQIKRANKKEVIKNIK